MNCLSRNYLLQNSLGIFKDSLPFFFCLVVTIGCKSQTGNYIANGSFEDRYGCAGPSYLINKAKFWSSIDSVSYGGLYFSTCNQSVPLNGNTYQYPKTGNAYVICDFYCPDCGRGYMKNRLKKN